eukprot:3554791-Rhodomonas_salina.3
MSGVDTVLGRAQTLLGIVATVTEDLHHVLAGASIKILKALRLVRGVLALFCWVVAAHCRRSALSYFS